ncbi:MAG: phosphoenolpyruvate--protein phosphotransferase, partial [Mesorhizobium sp.]
MLARSRGVPMIVGLGASPAHLAGVALLDAEHGGVILAPSRAEVDAFRRKSSSFAARRDRARTFLTRPAVT